MGSERSVIRPFFERSDFIGLRRKLGAMDTDALAAAYAGLAPMERLVMFKLLAPAAALALCRRLVPAEVYFLLCGFPLQSIAPVLDGLEGWQRASFHESPRGLHDEMLSFLAASA
ncbi:MAG: hypothetical protein HY927_13530 [Elusimicrobia bacterium]|nr:hypothetical protein [Elusimicrobiota bacterium]